MNALLVLISTIVVIFCLIVAAIVYNGVSLTTDPGFLPRLSHFVSNNSAQTDLNSRFPELRWQQIPLDADSAVERIDSLCQAQGWQLTQTASDGKAEPNIRGMNIIVTTRLLRFNDNIQIKIQQIEKNLSNITVNSASNVGKGDFGANLAHILKIRNKLMVD